MGNACALLFLSAFNMCDFITGIGMLRNTFITQYMINFIKMNMTLTNYADAGLLGTEGEKELTP